MSLKHLSISVVLAAGLLMTSCVDDKYDLSDIDTTVRVDVKDLTIPVNLDEILLSCMLEEGDQLKIIDGQYVISQDGSFTSSPIKIDKFTINSSELNPSLVDIPFVPAVAGAAGEHGYFDIVTPVEQFHFDATGVPEEITEIDGFGADLKFKFNLNLEGIGAIAGKVEFRNLTLQLPCGLTVTENEGGTYDPETGILTIPSRSVTGENLSLTIKADYADFKTMGASFDYDEHKIAVEGDFYVKGGQIAIATADLLPGAQPTVLKLNISYEIPSFEIKTVSGMVKYEISGVDMSDVDLSDLPDVLAQSGTDIRLENPQIYLTTNNPMQSYGLSARTGLTITSRHENSSVAYSINNPYFEIGTDNPAMEYTFCLSPLDPEKKLEGFADAVHVPFTSLSNVLSGDGLPKSLGVTLDNACLPLQHVNDFALGSELGEFEGDYQFIAPVALKEGSTIEYSDVMDGWGSEDLDDLTIEKLKVTAMALTDIPLDLEFTAYPIDAEGKQINNVKIEGVRLTASDKPQEVTITITGAIKGLDGIKYVANVKAPANEQVLKPDMKIRLSHVRANATGFYEKEL